MAPKKAPAAAKEEKPKKPEMSPELKAIKERERAVEKVEQPNKEEMDKAAEKIQTEIDKIQEKIKAVNAVIQERSHGKEEHYKMKEEIRGKLDEYSAKIDELEKSKQREMGGIREKQNESRERRNEVNAMKKKLGYDDVKDIDVKIREIEYQMQTESLSLKKEKELMNRMKELRASKPLVKKYETMEASNGPVDVSAQRLSVDEIKVQLNEVREAKKLQQAAYAKLIEARQKVMGDVPEFYTKREELKALQQAQYAARQELRDGFRKQQSAFNAYLSEVRVIRNERYQIERKEKQDAYDGKGKDAAVDTGAGDALISDVPFFGDILYLQNLTGYLETLMPKKEEEKVEAAVETVKAGAGETVLVAKGKREEEFFFAPTKKKNFKKGASSGKAKALKHDIKTLGFFSDYKITPPVDTSQLAKALADVKAKIEEFKVKQVKKIEDDKKKKEKKDAGGDDEEAPKEEAAAEA